jgi:hypothetical protein
MDLLVQSVLNSPLVLPIGNNFRCGSYTLFEVIDVFQLGKEISDVVHVRRNAKVASKPVESS